MNFQLLHERKCYGFKMCKNVLCGSRQTLSWTAATFEVKAMTLIYVA